MRLAVFCLESPWTRHTIKNNMKVILSRKGVDSSWGGHPGIILPDNTILYYPIPGDEDEDRYSVIKGTDGIAMDIGMKRFYQDIDDIKLLYLCHHKE